MIAATDGHACCSKAGERSRVDTSQKAPRAKVRYSQTASTINAATSVINFCLTHPRQTAAASLPVALQDLQTCLADFGPHPLQASENLHVVGNELATILHYIRMACCALLRRAFE